MTTTLEQAAQHLDELLQPTWLMVCNLRQGADASDVEAVREHCIAHLEATEAALAAAQVPASTRERVRYAQCALLDESILRDADEATRQAWTREPLQARYLGQHQAGDTLLAHMREHLQQPNPDPYAEVMYQRVLALGFHGRFEADAEEREALADAFDARVPGLLATPGVAVAQPSPRRGTGNLAARGLGHVTLAGVLLLVLWLGLGGVLDGVLSGWWS